MHSDTNRGMDEKDQIIAELREQVQMLLKRIEQLEEEIARLRKDSHNSSKPPSSDIVKPPKVLRRGKKRRRGGQPGHAKCSRLPFDPEQVDHVVQHELDGRQAQGLIALNQWRTFYQIGLPEKLFTVTEHRARKYLDPVTGKTVIAPLPEAIRKGGLLAADMTAMTAYMKGACHMSYTTIQQFFKHVIKLDLSRGMLCKATQKVSEALGPSYEALASRLPQEPQVNVDETGHHDDGKLHWTWCFDTNAYSLFKIDPSRSSQVLEAMLTADFTGVIGADYFGAYRKYARLFGVEVQYCLAHLIREIRFLAEHTVKKLSRWGRHLLEGLKKLFETLHRRDQLTPKGWMRSMERIREGFLKQMRRPPDHTLAKKLAKRFKAQAAKDYFRFLSEPGVEPTNNRAERQIRPVVIDRRITQGTRGQAGMRWCERIWTTLATCKKQNQNVLEFIHDSLVAHWSNKEYPSLIG